MEGQIIVKPLCELFNLSRYDPWGYCDCRDIFNRIDPKKHMNTFYCGELGADMVCIGVFANKMMIGAAHDTGSMFGFIKYHTGHWDAFDENTLTKHDTPDAMFFSHFSAWLGKMSEK